ncbi:MAG TPA: putative metal-dependent hydrolase [Bacteroidota bacterium]|nr:putative metal-dependent hydrolase [Bacteroidota bacterium]
MNSTDPRYPVGKFEPVSSPDRTALIREIADAPGLLREAVRGLTDQQLETHYREGGWTLRQVVHHVADSHMQAYGRCKLAVTEESPTIKPYHENLWAETPDARRAPVETSLVLISALHERWTMLLSSLSPADFSRTFRHPEYGTRELSWVLQLYAWHGRHHTAQITECRRRNGF